MSVADHVAEAGRFTGYDPAAFYDEIFTPDGAPRPEAAQLVDHFASLTPAQLATTRANLDTVFRNQGITFAVYSENEGDVERVWPMDLFPRIIAAAEWRHIEAGLAQRVTALNRFLEDIYVGEQAVLNDGLVPRWLITSSDGFERAAVNINVPNAARCLVAGIDIVRDSDGRHLVLEDNLRNPSGVSYVLENRSAMTRVLPRAFRNHQVRSVDHYGSSLLKALRNAAPPASADDPCVVVLTPGIYNSAYFEHAFLARQMGVELVEGRDLVVDDHVVGMRTTRGLERVDVVYRRIDDAFLDPVCFRADSTLGVPGIVGAARAGTVTIANAIGNGVADDKALYPFVPDLIDYYLDEEAILPNATTYVLWDADQRVAALERCDELVFKPVAASGGYGLVIGPHATDQELEDVKAAVRRDPRGWIAQEVIGLSRLPCVLEDEIAARHVDFRPFVLTGEQIEVLPGGLTRVALRDGSLVVNSSQGGGSKDTWVLAEPDEPTEPPTGDDF